ncbi:hypothetical protein KTO58_06340 [Chitinophaga pendula]|uniref:hypothetical protein n=1 Tax=Chitinophaga TaxID=79328 RepID=UPI0012FDD5F8|nr:MULTISPECIES: hypothetical protein [Chitinophaga]UCJ08806.1 hypothetical protein KTO58_06340 [Chitinophaga pendula]
MRSFNTIGLLSFLLLLGLQSFGQQFAQAGTEDIQNPRYAESQARYMKMSDSLTRTLSVTSQETYKAYDWYEAKLERRQQRREWRHLERMNRPRYSSWDYTNRFWNWGMRPSVGFRTGNWWFQW